VEPVVSCYACGAEAPLTRELNEVKMGTRSVTVEDEFYRCSVCDEEFYAGGMMDATLRRAAAAIREEDGLLGPDEIVEIRRKYDLSQADLENLIGAGEKTVVRWERGTVNQNQTADTLLRVLRDHPEIVAELAAERGVKLASPKKAPPRAEAA
jgi:HTH-type transcriptional regulator / antitoxin MqsA